MSEAELEWNYLSAGPSRLVIESAGTAQPRYYLYRLEWRPGQLPMQLVLSVQLDNGPEQALSGVVCCGLFTAFRGEFGVCSLG